MSSDFFADKKFEELDWISQAVEPWESPLSEPWANLPEVIDITAADFFTKTSTAYGSDQLNPAQAVLTQFYNSVGDSPDEVGTLLDRFEHIFGEFDFDDKNGFYALQLEDGTILDMEAKTLSHPIRLIKRMTRLSDQIHQRIVTNYAEVAMPRPHRYCDDEGKRAAEILDLLGHKNIPRGSRNRMIALRNAMMQTFSEDTLRIRSAVLAIKVVNWAVNYTNHGVVSALANLAKLKVMTHTGKPIYSMVEVE